MEAQLNRAFDLVAQPNNQAIKQGELLLQNLKKNPEYPLALLHHLNQTNVHDVLKLRAAIQLKLWCQYFRNIESFERQCYLPLIDEIKKNILIAYLTFPLKISKTLRPGLVALADVMFPNNWNDLLSNLLAYAVQNQNGVIPVLKLIQSISLKYTYEQRSDPLYEEIILMCNQVHDFLLELTVNTIKCSKQTPNHELIVTLEILLKIYYNLNYQDLHPKFQDSLNHWMNVLKQVMSLPNNNDKIMFKCKGAALQSILLYSNKYKEDIQGLIQDFCQQIWQLCSTATDDPEEDDIVFNCLRFFKSLVMWPDMRGFFQGHIENLFTNLIIPNIGLTKALVALFEDEVEQYIDFYFRSAQMNTRRAAAIDLLRVISRHYNSLFQPFLENQINSFQSIEGNMDQEICLIQLIIDGSSKAFRDVDGCTQLFVNESQIHFTYHNIIQKRLSILANFLGENNQRVIEDQFNPIYVSTILRFIFYFRIFIPKDDLNLILKFLTNIRTNSRSLLHVIYLTVNGFIILKHGDFVYYRDIIQYFKEEKLKPVAADIFKLIYEGTCKEQKILESLTKMLHNVSRGLGKYNDQFYQYQKTIIIQLLKKTKNYDFTSVQFLFESIGVISFHLIKNNSKNKSDLETIVLNSFMEFLKNKSDLMNFCLQILAIFLQLQSSTNDQYIKIYQSLLMQQNWAQDNQSLMSAYIQFLIAFIAKHREKLISDKGSVELVLSKIIEVDHIELFYRFMEAIMINTTLNQFFESGYLNLVVQGGQMIAGKSVRGRKSSLMFICKLVLFYDTVSCLNLINQCCQNYFDQLISVNLDVLKTLTQKVERKDMFASICHVARLNYFKNEQFLGGIINCLITNTSERFNIRNLSSTVEQNREKEKKQSTYKKLLVFKEFQNQPKQLQIVEEQQILNTFKFINENQPNILNYIDQKNKEKLARLNDNYGK